eukprot:TRINITY_DN6086_c0_g1_i1.p1 TRINITY_DN6086_c0_g1~~TRINITY_DN6086_c0_g1_i1.p1  ORF type:complete len:648 (+),score=200.66 TRINITY_DN6086_c0_g1_i1:121-2064(+)
MARYSFVLAVIAALLVSGAAAECMLGDFGTGECVGTQITSAAGGMFGYVANSIGDINNDGRGDFAIGSPEVSSDGSGTDGEVYIVFGTANAGMDFDVDTLNGMNGFKIVSKYDGARCGYALAALGDFNGDGIADFGFGCDRLGYVYDAEAPTLGEGVAYIVYGKESWDATVYVSDFDETDGAEFIGATNADKLGASLIGGEDLNGDGHPDVAIGGVWGATQQGFAAILWGQSANLEMFSYTADQATFDEYSLGILFEVSGWAKFGHNLKMGDWDGDSYPDLIVSHPGNSFGWNVGFIWVVFGTASDAVWASPFVINNYNADGQTYYFIRGPEDAPAAEKRSLESAQEYNNGQFGLGMDVGDVNGDGIMDIVASAPKSGTGSTYGSVWIIFGGDVSREYPAFTDLDDALASRAVRFNGAPGDVVYGEVNALNSPEDVVCADFNGDMFADVGFGTYNTNEGVGAVNVIWGMADTSAWLSVNNVADVADTWAGLGAGAMSGWSLGAVMREDQYICDLLVGSPGVNTVSRVSWADWCPPVKNVKDLMAYHDDVGAYLSFTRREDSTCEKIKGRPTTISGSWLKLENCDDAGTYFWTKEAVLAAFKLTDEQYTTGEVEWKIKSIVKPAEDSKCPKQKSSGRKVTSSYQSTPL